MSAQRGARSCDAEYGLALYCSGYHTPVTEPVHQSIPYATSVISRSGAALRCHYGTSWWQRSAFRRLKTKGSLVPNARIQWKYAYVRLRVANPQEKTVSQVHLYMLVGSICVCICLQIKGLLFECYSIRSQLASDTRTLPQLASNTRTLRLLKMIHNTKRSLDKQCDGVNVRPEYSD